MVTYIETIIHIPSSLLLFMFSEKIDEG